MRAVRLAYGLHDRHSKRGARDPDGGGELAINVKQLVLDRRETPANSNLHCEK